MQHMTQEGQHHAADHSDRPVQAVYPVATGASFTERGGKVIATSPIYLREDRMAWVGDTVRYPDGTEAKIISGVGAASVVDGRPLAIVGSALDNGDRIAGPVHNDIIFIQYADEPPIEGLLDPAYVPGLRESQRNG
ncbi:PAAR domain-containing protein [Chromobacterium sp. ASV23]|uniref:PAAR domain-containing protein n=1 Tax=Chromobacterium sp. ASV23 TaxID=2795110 RepID=UPI0018EB73A7|nr:PAAR domain-containing protein [Chromobacterium sp. ASV23]